jgi:hypothetical protein
MYIEPGSAIASSAAARARRVPSWRSVGEPARFDSKAKDVSARPYRVTGRVTSWFESTHVAGASTGACAASASVIDVRIRAASHGQARKSKLKAVCSSSGRR